MICVEDRLRNIMDALSEMARDYDWPVKSHASYYEFGEWGYGCLDLYVWSIGYAIDHMIRTAVPNLDPPYGLPGGWYCPPYTGSYVYDPADFSGCIPTVLDRIEGEIIPRLTWGTPIPTTLYATWNGLVGDWASENGVHTLYHVDAYPRFWTTSGTLFQPWKCIYLRSYVGVHPHHRWQISWGREDGSELGTQFLLGGVPNTSICDPRGTYVLTRGEQAGATCVISYP